MREAFGILEALIGLIVFSLIVLVSSQTLLEVHKDLKVYKQNNEIEPLNAFLYIRKVLKYSVVTQISKQEVSFYQINQNLFFSSSFDPLLQVCDSEKIPYKSYVDFVGIFSSSIEVIKAKRWENGILTLEKQPKCGIILPFHSPNQLSWRGGKLYLDHVVLLEEVQKFNFLDRGRFYEIEICTKTCLRQQILKQEIVYEI